MFFLAGFLGFTVIAGVPVQAADKVTAIAQAGKGYGRIILNFPKLPKYKAQISNGVLVLTFGRQLETDIGHIAQKLSDYLIIGRLDPDGKALRFALSQPAKINTIEAGTRLFIDIMPKNWVGLPPALPPQVVAELAARAEVVEKASRRRTMLKSLKDSKYKMKTRVVQFPTFTRIKFDWNLQVGAALKRKGDLITIIFDQLTKPNISRLLAEPPRYVKSSKAEITDDGLKIVLDIVKGTNVRGFREGTGYVVDISGPPDHSLPAKMARKLTGQKVGKNSKTSEHVEFKSPDQSKPQNNLKKTPKTPSAKKYPPRTNAGIERSPVVTSIRKPNHNGAIEKPLKAKPVQLAKQSPPAQPKTQKARSTTVTAAPVKAAPIKKAPAKLALIATPVIAAPKRARPASIDIAPADKFLKVEGSRIGSSLQLNFAFRGDIASAIFVRAKVLWVVFDTKQKLDISQIRKMKPKHLLAIKKITGERHQILKLSLSQPFLVSAGNNGTHWNITIGDLVAEKKLGIKLKRGLRSDGRAKVNIALKKPGKIHWVKDKEIGDTLGVVTAFAPIKTMQKSRRFVDFTSLATIHGLALQVLSDNLNIRLVKGEVLVTRAQGLRLSSSGIHQRNPSQRAMADQTHPGRIDFKAWRGRDPRQTDMRIELLHGAISAMPDKQSIGFRFELARIFLARLLHAEALGIMKRIVEIDQQVEKDPVFNVMRGVANLLLYRLKEARKDLSVRGLARDIDAELWRALLDAREGKWRSAQISFLKAERALGTYPVEIKTMFRLAAARAALGNNDISTARFQLDSMPKRNIALKVIGQVHVLRGRLSQALGDHDKALMAYKAAIGTYDRKAESEARFHHVLLSLRLGRVDPGQAIGELQRISLSWRGDNLELEVLRKLAQLQHGQKQFRASLSTMKTAVKAYPRNQMSRHIQDEMTRLFEQLFLRGRADDLPPIKALSLYYDFRELTPVGRRGDQMIRRLADRLIAVDLLAQAAEILNHQVKKRLIGAARAQVSAKLAMVYLLDQKPVLALKTLRQSRVAVLPKNLRRKRLLLEARALSELGRPDPAIALLANETGRDVALLRAESLWRGKKWQAAGEAFEKLLGSLWQSDGPLGADDRLHVLRAAISYSLAGDKLGLARFRNKYSRKMAQSPDVKSFEVVTQTINSQGIEFRNLAAEIAAINTLKGFLGEFRKRFKLRPQSLRQPTPIANQG